MYNYVPGGCERGVAEGAESERRSENRSSDFPRVAGNFVAVRVGPGEVPGGCGFPSTKVTAEEEGVSEGVGSELLPEALRARRDGGRRAAPRDRDCESREGGREGGREGEGER